ncbi:MutS 4 [Choanephora cucurbitarum]|uniref:DNA mismatch repair protein MSH3 n=1 Tax=Choanephora cucurbitarum TaxID=101091 RepID=A0A1C7NBH0_9FUNG|nr:MutS 4 [Choanephora cucurbitarum]
MSLTNRSVTSPSLFKRRTASCVNRPEASQFILRPTTAGTTRSAAASNRIMAIAEGKGITFEIGICTFDITSCEITLCQFSDQSTYSQTLQKIYLNEPLKIIMSNSYPETQGKPNNEQEENKLKKAIQQQFPHTPILFLTQKLFNKDVGKQWVQEYALQEDAAGLLIGISTKHCCLAAFAAVFRYAIDTENYTFTPHTIKFTYQGAEGSMMIDAITAKNLELVANTTDSHTHNTLFDVLNRTSTPMGKRLLRINILQPPCSLDVIKHRLDMVEMLSQSEECIFNIQACLKHLVDLDHTIAYIVKMPRDNESTKKSSSVAIHHAETKINQVVGLKQTIKSILSIATCLTPKKDCLLINKIYTLLNNPVFHELERIIQDTVNEEVCIQKTSLGIQNQRCYAIKAGVNGLLDVARQTYKETTEDIYELVEQYNESYGLQMKLQFNASNGFYITMVRAAEEECDLPTEFINVIKKKKTVQCTTVVLLQKNFRIHESLTEVYLMSDQIVTELLKVFRDNINVLYKASEAIALLDMLTALAACNVSSDYVRPEFSNTIAIKAGRHPILSQILSFPLVPNDTFASLSSSFQFITGPNMSGKSTYLRQVALLTIMAHIGSFVPAEYACFRLTDQLLSRLANDNSFSDIGTSSFMSEMRETAYLLQHVTDRSLVIIDELGRSTSPNDALCIAAAVCEDLVLTKAFCFFATHLHQLTRTLDVYPNVVNLQFKVNVTKTKDSDYTVDYQYKIEDGSLNSKASYGKANFALLILFKLKAKILLQFENQGQKTNPQIKKDEQVTERERKLLWFADKVLQLGQVQISNEQLHDQFYQLQNNMLEEKD